MACWPGCSPSTRSTAWCTSAAKKQVEESVRRPLYYYRQNVEGLRVLLEAATAAGVASFVFSSSAAVYGSPRDELVREDTDCRPVNPYGTTKLVGEQMVADVAAATGLRYAGLRYFNVAGAATPELADRGAINLVPMVFERLTGGQPPRMFGDDHDTPDGTCIRDFVHVADIASAHVAAARGPGRGTGDRADGQHRPRRGRLGPRDGRDHPRGHRHRRPAWAEPVVQPRRAGDPARVVACADLLRDALGWRS